MPKAQVLVTVTAEALVEIPEGIVDVEAFCRDRVGLTWEGLEVERVVQSPSVAVEHFLVPEPEPVEADAVESPHAAPFEEAREEPEVAAAPAEEAGAPLALLDDPAAYREVIRAAVRGRAERLLEEVVEQVVAELEPLLERHFSRRSSGAS